MFANFMKAFDRLRPSGPLKYAFKRFIPSSLGGSAGGATGAATGAAGG